MQASPAVPRGCVCAHGGSVLRDGECWGTLPLEAPRLPVHVPSSLSQPAGPWAPGPRPTSRADVLEAPPGREEEFQLAVVKTSDHLREVEARLKGEDEGADPTVVHPVPVSAPPASAEPAPPRRRTPHPFSQPAPAYPPTPDRC